MDRSIMYDDIVVFTSAEDFLVLVQTDRNAAHLGLARAQMTLDLEDCWVQFTDLDTDFITFGKVAAVDEIRTVVPDLVVGEAENLGESSLLLSHIYSRHNQDGLLAFIPRAHVWPIEHRLYEMVKQVGWDYRMLDQVGRFLLEVAFRQMRAHVVGR